MHASQSVGQLAHLSIRAHERAPHLVSEQALGKPLDARSDVFSFGATLYEALSGKRAFSGDSILDTLNAVVSREPEPLDSPLSSVVNRCLAKG